MKKRNDKGFTLVELIVVLVILAILAAILVPALLGYIDKAREKQVTTNAEAAYVAAQALATEYYGKNTTLTKTGRADYVTVAGITKLTDIQTTFTAKIAFKSDTEDAGTGESATKATKDFCIVTQFEYTENGSTAVWDNATGGWTVYGEKDTVVSSTAAGGSLTAMK